MQFLSLCRAKKTLLRILRQTNFTIIAGLVFTPLACIACAKEISDLITWHDKMLLQNDTTLFVTDVDDSAKITLEAVLDQPCDIPVQQ